MRRWLFTMLYATDQWFNAAFGGYPDETISSRAGKAKLKGKRWGVAMCRFLDWLDPGHCVDAIEEDEGEPPDRARRGGL